MKKIISLFCTITLLMSSVSVYANSTTTSMGIGYNHTGIVTEAGQLLMQGRNEYGEFGVGATTPDSLNGFIESIKGVVAVACGYGYSTAVIKTDGTLWVCGRNNYGQLGNGTLEDSSLFIQMDTNVVKVGAGDGYFIYLKKDGSLWGVGYSGGRVLLNSSESIYGTKPIKIMTGIKDFSTYSRNTAVINTKNELYMFGDNTNGQLGIGNTKDCYDLTLPVKVLDNVRSVSCGTDYVLAVKYDNTLYSWGKNDYCQLMNGKTSYDSDYVPVYSPTKVAENVLKACAGKDDSGYITTDHKLYMTGNSLYGQAGFDPTTLPIVSTITKPVLVAENVADVAIHEHTIYTTIDGKTYTAGHNINGAGDYYDGFMERPIAVAAQYDFSNLLSIGDENKVITLVDIGNVWTELNADNLLPFTAEINPNEPGLSNQIELIDEIWRQTDDADAIISLSRNKDNPVKPIAGKKYSYSVVVKAKDGYVFGDSFNFIYGGTRYTPTVVFSEDKKIAIISGFIKDVTVEKAKQPMTIKAKQPMTIKAKMVKVKYNKLKKKKMVVKAITVKNAQGTVSYAKVNKGSSAKLSINKKTGKITVKKGTKKGNYKIVVKVTAKGNEKYLKGSKILKVKVKVK